MMETLIIASDAPIGMRGPLAAIALEGLAKLVGHLPPAPLEGEHWEKLRQDLLGVLSKCDAPKSVKESFNGKISRLNEPSNAAKLVAPFEYLGISLNDEERKAISGRNRHLHGRGGQPLDDWRTTYREEAAMTTVATKLLLRVLGLGGLIMINEGKVAIADTSDALTFGYSPDDFCVA